MRRTRWLAVTLLLSGAGACAHGAESLVRSGTKGGVEGGLEALTDPHNRKLLLRLLQDPEIQAAAHDLTAALSGGAIDGLSDEQRVQRVREASDAYIRTIAAAVGAALDEDISPAVARAVKEGVGDAVAGALRPANQRLAQAMVDGVTRTVITAFTQSTARGLREDLGPALTQVLTDDLGPALQRVIEDNLGPALRKVIERDLQPAIAAALGGEDGGASGVFARALTKQIVLGVNDGMSELGISPSPNAKDSVGLSWWLIVPATLALLVLLLLLRMYFVGRANARDRARSEEMLVNILRAVKSADSGAPEAAIDLDTVIARVRQHMPDLDNDHSYLATIVGRAQLPSRPSPTARKRRAVGEPPAA